MVKNSFSIFETLLSITILTIVVSGFYKSSYYDSKISNKFVLLNDLENKFNTNNYNNLNFSFKNLQIIKNKLLKENIIVKKYSFENEELKIFKYEK